MARVIDQSELRMEWADTSRRVHHPWPESHPRSPGVHLSGVLRYIAIESGLLVIPKPDVDSTPGKDIDESEMPLRMMLGMFFEEGIVSLYPDLIWQPGEFERDQVFGTPDGLSILDNRLVVEEFKLTWKSEWNYGKEKFTGPCNWMWLSQGKGYLALLQHAGYDIAPIVRFHVCWNCGDYRPPSPKIVRYTVEFSQLEIDSLWKLIVRHRDNPNVKRES